MGNGCPLMPGSLWSCQSLSEMCLWPGSDLWGRHDAVAAEGRAIHVPCRQMVPPHAADSCAFHVFSRRANPHGSGKLTDHALAYVLAWRANPHGSGKLDHHALSLAGVLA